MPVKREEWRMHIETLTPEAAARLDETARAVAREFGVYRRQFRAPKR
jgi:hypothetical protein